MCPALQVGERSILESDTSIIYVGFWQSVYTKIFIKIWTIFLLYTYVNELIEFNETCKSILDD